MPITRKQAIRDLDLKVGGPYCPPFLDDENSVSPKGLINSPRLIGLLFGISIYYGTGI